MSFCASAAAKSLGIFDLSLLFRRQKNKRFGICDFETQRFAISYRDFSAVFVAILNLRFENAAVAIAILWDAKEMCQIW